MSWLRAVWQEKGKEEEGTVPDCWVRGNTLYWPPGPNAMKVRKERKTPGKNWTAFPLIKVKHSSGTC